MEFVGYDTRDKLLWASDEVSRNNNKINKPGIPKSHTNKISPS